MNRNQIGGKLDEAKGRVKKAAGEITGNDRAKAEGTVDKVVGKVRQVAGNVQEKLHDATRPDAHRVDVDVDVKKE